MASPKSLAMFDNCADVDDVDAPPFDATDFAKSLTDEIVFVAEEIKLA